MISPPRRSRIWFTGLQLVGIGRSLKVLVLVSVLVHDEVFLGWKDQ
jgi:hypothetical protein